MVFGDALENAKAGKKIYRKVWHSKIIYVAYSKDMKPYLVFSSRHYKQMPYVPTNNDLFAYDWEII